MENYHLQAVELAVGAGARYFRGAKGDHREPWIENPCESASGRTTDTVRHRAAKFSLPRYQAA
jgi:hypothetical protein